jgi:XTP/dITP diphosphohydrolase
MPKLAVATTNRGKLREIAELLRGLPFELVTLAEWPDVAAPEETGQTFAENARLKALYYAAHTGELTVADDSGLEIDALDGAPGGMGAGADSTYAVRPYFARCAARREPGAGLWRAGAGAGGRIVFGNPRRSTAAGSLREGTGGFGYDPIFLVTPPHPAEAGDRKPGESPRNAFACAAHLADATGPLVAPDSIDQGLMMARCLVHESGCRHRRDRAGSSRRARNGMPGVPGLR